MIREAVRFGRS